jgi:hypothetical protein
VRHVLQLHFNELFSNNKVSIKIIQYSPISVDFLPLILYPAIALLGILYFINAYASDGQHKEPQQQQQQQQ